MRNPASFPPIRAPAAPVCLHFLETVDRRGRTDARMDEGVRLRRRRRRRWSHLATSGVVKYSAAVIIFFVAESPGPANDVCEREALLSIGSSIG